MDEDPWGTQTPSAVAGEVPPLPARLVELVALVASGKSRFLEAGERWVTPSAEELPEVQVLAVDGWRPLGQDPMTVLLPAVWPPQHRAWVPDRLPRMSTSACLPDLRQSVQGWPERCVRF